MAYVKKLLFRAMRIANAAIAPLRIRIVPLSQPTRDFAGFVRHLRGLGMDPRTVIDVGVAFGTPGLYSSMRGAKFYLVEPVPSCRPLLDRMEREIGATCFNVAAGSADGEMAFFVHGDVSGSSAFQQWEGAAMDGHAVRVPVRRLDSLVPADAERPILLKIDTQGAELQVIAGAERLLPSVDVAIVECSFHQFRKGAPEIDQVIAAMVARGFRCYDVLEGHFRSVDRALAQVDVVFVREDSPLRRERGFFGTEQVADYVRRSSGTR
jgi:FkbM family methyltransferase